MLRLYNVSPIDTLTAQLATILHLLICGPVTFETFRDLAIIARNVVMSVDTDGKCESKTLELDDLIDAICRAEDTYKNEIAIGTTLSPERLFTYTRRQIVERKNNDAIKQMIASKKLTCKNCQTWYNYPSDVSKSGSIFKRCCGFEEVYEYTPACTKIEPFEEVQA